MVISNFEELMREHMDYTDRNTIKAIAEASSENQNQMLVALTSKLYEMIVAKVTKIDYTSISRSRGDITKIENFDKLVETIGIIGNIVEEYNCDKTPVLTVTTAIDNISTRSGVFKRAFVINAPLPQVLYNTIAMSIVASVSFMVDTCVEYIKNPQSESFQMAIDVVSYNETMKTVMFETLETFNNGCKSGDIDAALDVSMKQSKVKRESTELFEEKGSFDDKRKAAMKSFIDKYATKIALKVAAAVAAGIAVKLLNKGADKEALQASDVVQDMCDSIEAQHKVTLAEAEALCKMKASDLNKMQKEFKIQEDDIKIIHAVGQELKERIIEREQTKNESSFLSEDEISIAHDSPFLSAEEIESSDEDRMVVHDDSEELESTFTEGFDSLASVVGRGLLALCKLVIPLIRHVVYMYYYSRQRVSDYFESNALAIEMNAYQVQYNQEIDPERRAEIYKKQMKIAESLKRKAQRTSIDYKKSKKMATDEEKREEKKFTSDEIGYNSDALDSTPAMAGSALF